MVYAGGRRGAAVRVGGGVSHGAAVRIALVSWSVRRASPRLGQPRRLSPHVPAHPSHWAISASSFILKSCLLVAEASSTHPEEETGGSGGGNSSRSRWSRRHARDSSLRSE